MSTVNGVGSGVPVQPVVRQAVQKQLPAEPAKSLPVTDKLQLSGVSHLLNNLKENDIRADKVAAIRQQIEAGTYEDDYKLDVAVDRLLDDLS